MSSLSFAVRRADRILDRRAARVGRRHAAVALVAFVAAFALFAALVPAGLTNGDAAVYAEQIEDRDFRDRGVHVAYYFVSALLLGFPDEISGRALNLLAALFGALTVALVAWATAVASGRPMVGAWAGASLLASWTFARESIVAEVYAPQTFFLALAAWAWTRRRAAGAGVSLAVSTLHTPSSLLAVPAFLVARPEPRRVAILGAVGSAITLSVIAWIGRDYFYGDRGLLQASGAGLGLVEKLVKEGVEVVFGVFCLLPFLALGGARLVRRRHTRPLVAALGTLWVVTFVFGERFADVPVQLPTWVALAPVVALGVGELEARLRAARPLLARALVFGVTLLALAPVIALALVRSRSRVFAAASNDTLVTITALVLAAAGLAFWRLGGGVEARERAARTLFLGSVAAGLVLVTTLATAERDRIDGYREHVLALAPSFAPLTPEVPEEGAAMAVAGWSRGILFERYLFGESYTGRVVVADWWSEGGGAAGERARVGRDRALAAGAEIWLLGEHPEAREALEARGYRFESGPGDFHRGLPPSLPGDSP